MRSLISVFLVQDDIASRIAEAHDMFHFRRQGSTPVLLIIDRRDDPVTPLLSQWTYQAQVHELLGLDMNRVDLSNVPDLQEGASLQECDTCIRTIMNSHEQS